MQKHGYQPKMTRDAETQITDVERPKAITQVITAEMNVSFCLSMNDHLISKSKLKCSSNFLSNQKSKSTVQSNTRKS